MTMTFDEGRKEVQQKMNYISRGFRSWKLYASLALFFISVAIVMFAIALTIRSNEQSDRLHQFQREAECRTNINAELEATGVEIKMAMSRLMITQAEADIALYNGQSLAPFVEPYQTEIFELKSIFERLVDASNSQRDAVKICNRK